MKLKFSPRYQILWISFSCSPVFPCRLTDRQTYITKLMVTFRNFANAPTTAWNCSSSRTCDLMSCTRTAFSYFKITRLSEAAAHFTDTSLSVGRGWEDSYNSNLARYTDFLPLVISCKEPYIPNGQPSQSSCRAHASVYHFNLPTR